MDKKDFYITTPIYYANAGPHVGHAYATTISDVIARYHRLQGDETFFLTGTADHGEKIMRTAEKQGMTPQELTDDNVEKFKNLYKELNISNDSFIRNSDKENHWPGAQALWKKLAEAEDIYKDSYKGLYCVGCEKFLTEKDLVDGKCPDHDTFPEVVEEENYFFRLSKYSEQVRKIIEDGTLAVFPESRKKELLSFIDMGLEDISFSRPAEKVSWAIPVPDDPTHNMYVWCEELSNYISALGYGRDDDLFKKFWPADLHVVGKDILRFHAIVWPAMLFSAGIPLPKAILAHGLVMSGGKKMSKTIGNVIDPQELIEEYGSEAVRYYLARHISPFSDGDMTKEGFKDVYNGELANGLGNLVARIMKLAEMYLSEPITIPQSGSFPDKFIKMIEAYELNHTMDLIWGEIQKLDHKITETEPFKLIKTDPEKAKEIIGDLVSGLHEIAILLKSFMPETSEKIMEAINANKKPETLFARID